MFDYENKPNIADEELAELSVCLLLDLLHLFGVEPASPLSMGDKYNKFIRSDATHAASSYSYVEEFMGRNHKRGAVLGK